MKLMVVNDNGEAEEVDTDGSLDEIIPDLKKGRSLVCAMLATEIVETFEMLKAREKYSD